LNVKKVEEEAFTSDKVDGVLAGNVGTFLDGFAKGGAHINFSVKRLKIRYGRPVYEGEFTKYIISNQCGDGVGYILLFSE
jgi:hypothetical protein